MEISESMIMDLKRMARKIEGRGTLTIHFMENPPMYDIEISDRVRFSGRHIPQAGEVVKTKKVIVVKRDSERGA